MNEDDLYEARLELVDFGIAVFWDVPEAAFLERLLGDGTVLPEDSVNGPIDEGFEMLGAWIDENRGRPIEEISEEVNVEYTDLFVGPRPPVLLHETHYREDTEFIGEGLAEVEASYGAAGWTPPEDDEYPEENDFVAVELAFLRWLVARQREGMEEAFGYERVFLDNHIDTWVEDAAADVRAETDNDLFLAAGEVLAGVFEFEDELVAQMV